jgi:hypothetical protein
MKNIKCVFTTMGLLMGEMTSDSKGKTITITNPRIIQQTQEGLGLTNFLTLFNETEITFDKSQVVSNLLEPIEKLLMFYEKEFEPAAPEIILPENNVIQLR